MLSKRLGQRHRINNYMSASFTNLRALLTIQRLIFQMTMASSTERIIEIKQDFFVLDIW